MKGLLVTTSLSLALIAAQPAWAENNAAAGLGQEFQVAAADPGQVDAFLKDQRAAPGLSVPELRARLRAGRGLIQAGGLEPGMERQIRGKMREVRDELAKRGGAPAQNQNAQGEDDGDGPQPQAAQPAQTNQQQAQAQTQAPQAAQPAQSSAEVATYLAKPDLKSLDAPGLRNRIRTGRGLIAQGKVARKDRRAVVEAVRAAQAELRSRQSKNQGNQAAQPDTGAEPSQQQAQTQQQTQEQPTGQAAAPAQSAAEVQTYLAANPDLKTLDVPGLRNRMRTGRTLIREGKVSRRDRRAVVEAVRAAQAELGSRGGGAGNQDGQQAGQAGQPQGGGAARPEDVPQDQAGRIGPPDDAGTSLLNDKRNAQALSDRELAQRLRQLRAVLAIRTLPVATQRSLRQMLVADRTEYRRRIAMRNDRKTGTGEDGQQRERPSGFYLTDRRQSRELAPWDLRLRINRLTIIINDNSYPRARRDEYAAILAADRAELRRRFLANRDERRSRLRQERDKGQLNIGININIGNPPPLVRGYPQPVYVAEADDEEIERQFVAPPVRKPERRYTVEEVVEDEEVRRTMPAVELDTIRFGFNEDFIREEGLDAMDKVGDVIERILAAHPDEIFLIEGHTDAVGSDGYNLDLSRRRAAAVTEALSTYFNIRAESLKPVGYGERYLKIPVQEEEAENRRVTIRRVTPLVGEAG